MLVSVWKNYCSSLRMGIRRNRNDKPLSNNCIIRSYWECMLMISSAFCLVHQGLSCLSSDWTSPNCDSFYPLSWRSIEDLAESWTLPPKVPWWKTWVSWYFPVLVGGSFLTSHFVCWPCQGMDSKRSTVSAKPLADSHVGLLRGCGTHTWGDSHDNYCQCIPIKIQHADVAIVNI